MAEPARAPEDLYGLPLEEFTRARDALAKELRTRGDQDGAAEVKRLRKPSLAAWALNQTARRHGPEVRRLLEAGAASREAQEEALAGDAGALREASRALGEQIERVADLAATELSGTGREPSPAQRDRIVATLRAAAADEQGGRLLERGILVDELEPAGFGAFGAMEPVARPSGSGGRASTRAPRKRSPEEQETIEAARREVRRAEAEAEAAATRARRRAERAEAAERRAREAQLEAEAARSEAEDAAGEAEAARRRAEEAARRLAEAEAG